MSRACTAYIEEARREGLWESRDDHERAGGWYSEAVLAYVVRWKIAQNTLGAYTHMKLDLDNPVQPAATSARRVFDADTLGVIVNKDQVHWVAFKAVSGQIWLLDSQMRGPELYDFPRYQAFLLTYRHAFCLCDND